MPEFSVLILTRNETQNLEILLPQIVAVFSHHNLSYEIVVVDSESSEATTIVTHQSGARIHKQSQPGYGAAFREGVALCTGEWIITLDADLSHPPQFLESLIANKGAADLLIGSRYVPGGTANMEIYRYFLSRALNSAYRLVLGVNIQDLSSGYRMYRSLLLKEISLVGKNFDVLIEVLVKLISRGAVVKELPFHYEPRVFGKSNARLFRFAVSYLRTLVRMKTLLHNKTP